MRGYRNILTLLLAVLFPLVTIHCKLEKLPAFEFLSCETAETVETAAANDSHSHKSDDCEKDGCELLEGGFYKIEDCQVSTAADPLLSAEILLPETATLPSLSISENQSAATPPELPVTWQFSTRSAAPPRAPSFVS